MLALLRLLALPLALACLAPVQAQTPPPPTAAALALRNPENDRQTLAEAIQSRDIDKATRILDADPPIIKMLDNQNRLPLTEAVAFNWGEDRTSMLALLIARARMSTLPTGRGRRRWCWMWRGAMIRTAKCLIFWCPKGPALRRRATTGRLPFMPPPSTMISTS